MLYVYAYAVILAVLTLGYFLVRLPIIRKAYLPTSVGAGLLLLALGAEAGKVFPEWLYAPLEPLPELLINVVFGTLFLGRPLLKLREMWHMAGPQAAYGQMTAWGFYFVGGLVTLLLLTPMFGVSPLTGALLEMSFEGGHGTAAGMIPVFNELDFAEGQELTVAMATTSLISALIVGFILINWGRRKNLAANAGVVREAREKFYYWKIFRELRLKGIQLKDELSFGSLIIHLALVAVAVAGGIAIHYLLLHVEQATWGQNGIKIFGYMPVFTFCMFGGMIAQAVWSALGMQVSRAMVELIASAALGVLVTTAIGTMSLDFIARDGLVFLILVATGVLWVLGCFVFLARRMFAQHWFTNAIVSLGQSMGTTATGLMFAQMVDPKQKSGAVEGFGYKQLLFEPLMGGGMVTALSMPLIVLLGLPVFTAVTGGICVFWMIFGMKVFGKNRL